MNKTCFYFVLIHVALSLLISLSFAVSRVGDRFTEPLTRPFNGKSSGKSIHYVCPLSLGWFKWLRWQSTNIISQIVSGFHTFVLVSFQHLHFLLLYHGQPSPPPPHHLFLLLLLMNEATTKLSIHSLPSEPPKIQSIHSGWSY